MSVAVGALRHDSHITARRVELRHGSHITTRRLYFALPQDFYSSWDKGQKGLYFISNLNIIINISTMISLSCYLLHFGSRFPAPWPFPYHNFHNSRDKGQKWFQFICTYKFITNITTIITSSFYFIPCPTVATEGWRGGGALPAFCSAHSCTRCGPPSRDSHDFIISRFQDLATLVCARSHPSLSHIRHFINLLSEYLLIHPFHGLLRVPQPCVVTFSALVPIYVHGTRDEAIVGKSCYAGTEWVEFCKH